MLCGLDRPRQRQLHRDLNREIEVDAASMVVTTIPPITMSWGTSAVVTPIDSVPRPYNPMMLSAVSQKGGHSQCQFAV